MPPRDLPGDIGPRPETVCHGASLHTRRWQAVLPADQRGAGDERIRAEPAQVRALRQGQAKTLEHNTVEVYVAGPVDDGAKQEAVPWPKHDGPETAGAQLEEQDRRRPTDGEEGQSQRPTGSACGRSHIGGRFGLEERAGLLTG